MRFMGWSHADYDTCPVSLRDEIWLVMAEARPPAGAE